MNILLLCNNDLPSLFAVNLLLPRLNQHQLTLGQSTRVGGNQQHPVEITKLAAFEAEILNNPNSETAEQLFKRVFESKLIADSVKNTHSINLDSMQSFESVCQLNAIERIELNQINHLTSVNLVRELQPDLILSIRFGKILQQPIIDIPTHGVINLHSGLLPNYQGVMASFWAMLNKETSIGSCLHFIDDKQIDAGRIIQQSSIELNDNMSYLENVLRLYVPGVAMMVKAVEKLTAGLSLSPVEQQGQANYYGFPKADDLTRFKQLGFRLF